MNEDNQAYVEVVKAKEHMLNCYYQEGVISEKKYNEQLKELASHENLQVFELCATEEQKGEFEKLENERLAGAAIGTLISTQATIGVCMTDRFLKTRENDYHDECYEGLER